MGLLDGGIAARMASVMSRFYLPATLRTVIIYPDDGGGGTGEIIDIGGWVLEFDAWDDTGLWLEGLPWDISGYVIATSQPVKVQEDRITEEDRAAGGYSQKAKRFIILQSGTTGLLTGDSELIVDGETYMLSAPEQDPAKAYWYVVGVPK